MGELGAPVPFQWAGGRQPAIRLGLWRSLFSPGLLCYGADFWPWFFIFHLPGRSQKSTSTLPRNKIRGWLEFASNVIAKISLRTCVLSHNSGPLTTIGLWSRHTMSPLSSRSMLTLGKAHKSCLQLPGTGALRFLCPGFPSPQKERKHTQDAPRANLHLPG